jgi:hypothetical protein
MKNKYNRPGQPRPFSNRRTMAGTLSRRGMRALLLCGMLGLTSVESTLALPSYSVRIDLPALTCPGNITTVNDAGTCGAVVTYPTPQATLGSLPVTTSLVGGLPSGATFPLGATIVTYEATDTAGNRVACSFTVTVVDSETPTVVTPPTVVVNTEPGRCSASGVVLGTPIIGDNCTGVTVTNNAPVPGDKLTHGNYPLGTTTVIWTVTDATGNTSTGTQLVIVVDNERPTITAPANVTVRTDQGLASASQVVLGSATAGDNCTGVTVSNNAPAAFPLGTTVVTWTATDVAGNTSTATQTVTVTDQENPSIAAPAAVAIGTDAGQCHTSQVALGSATVADNAPGVVVSNDAPASYAIGTTTVTWTATDAAGNTATATQAVVVTDRENPTIVAPAAVVVNAGPGQVSVSGIALGTATAGDNCAGLSITNNAPATYPQGTTVVTWTATDAAGNTATATQLVTVIVRDTQAPSITAPANVTVSASAGQCSASGVALGTPRVTDNFPGVVVSNNAPATYAIGTTTVTWTATDAAGNVATATQTVTVADTERPSLTLPANIVLTATSTQCNQAVIFRPTATDNCGQVTVVCSPASGSLFASGTTTVNVTATDAGGNTRTGSFTIRINDVTRPIARTRNVTVTLVNGVATVTPAQVNNGSSDVCGIASLTLSRTTFSCANRGSNTVTLTVADAAGNVSTANAVVTVTGSVSSPSITVTRSSSVYTGGPNNTIFLGYGAQSATLTASGGVSYRWSPALALSNPNIANPVFTPTVEGTYTYTVTATNQYGCTATASVTLRVIDADCGNNRNNPKVLVCHNGHEICISPNAVPAHLNNCSHDDQLGPCVPSHGCSRDMTADAPATAVSDKVEPVAAARPLALPVVLEAFPNPFAASTTVHFRTAETAPAQVRIYDHLGKLVATLFNDVAEGGQDYSLTLSAEKLATGLYVCQFMSQGKVQIQRLTIVK